MGHSHVVHCSTLFIDLLLFFFGSTCAVALAGRLGQETSPHRYNYFKDMPTNSPPIGDVAEQVGSNEELIAEIQGFRS